MDGPRDEAIERDRLVDRGVEGDADDASDGAPGTPTGSRRRPDRQRARPPRPPPRVGWASVPPAARVDSDPHATASRSAASSGRPFEPGREEPGVERVAGAGRVDGVDGDRRGAGQGAVRADRQPAVGAVLDGDRATGDAPATEARASAAASRSSTPASARHSAAFGKSTFASKAAARKPRPICTDGSQLGSKLPSTPLPREPPGTAPGARRPVPAGGSSCRRGRCRARARSAAGTSAARTSAIVPIAVRIARSVPLPRITEAPVARPARHPARGHVDAAVGQRRRA